MKALASVKAVVLSQRSLWDRDLQMDSPLLEGVEKVGFAALHGVLKGCVRLVRNPVADESLPGARRQALADTVRPQFCMKEQEIARSVRRAPMRLLNLCCVQPALVLTLVATARQEIAVQAGWSAHAHVELS